MHHGVKQGCVTGVGYPFGRFSVGLAESTRDLGLDALATPFALQSLWDYQQPGNPATLPIGTVAVDLIGGVNLTLAAASSVFLGEAFAGRGGWHFRVPPSIVDLLQAGVGDYNIDALSDFFNPYILRFRRLPVANRQLVGKVAGVSLEQYQLLYQSTGNLAWQCINAAGTTFTAIIIANHSETVGYTMPFVNRSSNISGIKSPQGYAEVSIIGAGAFSDGTGNYRQMNVSGSSVPGGLIWGGATLTGAPANQAEATQIGYNLWRGWRGVGV